MSIVQTDVPMTYGLCHETIEKIVEAYPVCSSRSRRSYCCFRSRSHSRSRCRRS